MLGLRHAFNADHIAAIDNVVRKLTQGKHPSVGFFFLLDHSSIVVLGYVVIAAAGNQLHVFHDIGGVIGTSISALFLLMMDLTTCLS